jgi:hypothetical protein
MIFIGLGTRLELRLYIEYLIIKKLLLYKILYKYSVDYYYYYYYYNY